MLEINIDEVECFDDVTQTFSKIEKQTLHLEHSLVSISKWEAKWNKPFLNTTKKTLEEFRYYVKCMTLDKKVNDNVYMALSVSNIREIQKYIDAPMSAAKFYGKNQNASINKSKRITSELIYYWMISLNIPFECQKWHLNRLMSLIKVCQSENEPKKKINTQARANEYASINAARRKALKTKG